MCMRRVKQPLAVAKPAVCPERSRLWDPAHALVCSARPQHARMLQSARRTWVTSSCTPVVHQHYANTLSPASPHTHTHMTHPHARHACLHARPQNPMSLDIMQQRLDSHAFYLTLDIFNADLRKVAGVGGSRGCAAVCMPACGAGRALDDGGG